jgi:hypothetical protein
MTSIELDKGLTEELAAKRAWSSFLEANLDRFRRTMAVPMGELLGCGLWGCVFDSEPPWVVKLTRDRTEGPIWAYMAELLGDSEVSAELDAFLRVRDVVRIHPDVIFGSEEMPVYGIVREAAEPVLRRPDFATEETLRRLGMTPAILERAGIDPKEPSLSAMSDALSTFPQDLKVRMRELFIVLMSLQDYRRHALIFHSWRGKLMRRAYDGLSKEEVEDIADRAFQEMLAAIEKMRGHGYVNRYGDIIGQTLLSAVQYGDLVFQDLHLLNVGWRVHAEIEGDVRPLSMVILDPGAMATPYEPPIRETELLENLGRHFR